MSFFDDDGFDNIVREFFGSGSREAQARRKEIIRGEEEDRHIDFVETKDNVFLVFELPGYNEKEVVVEIKGSELEVSAKKKNGEEIQTYLNEKLRGGVLIKRNLPKGVNAKKFSHTMKNGVLEISFERRGK